MKIALIGYGKMGMLIHELALQRNFSVVAIIDSKMPLDTPQAKESISDADVCIDFSSPQAVLNNIKILASLKKNIVVGTTGWDKHLNEVERLVKESGIGLLHAPNFSIGVALFLKMIAHTANLMAQFNLYDVAGIEMHHSKKLDAPSGTAKAIENITNSAHPAHPLTFSSVRVGNIPGMHSVVYDSPADTITLTHTARNREGFAHGALNAAEWISGKKGLFTMENLLQGYSHAKI